MVECLIDFLSRFFDVSRLDVCDDDVTFIIECSKREFDSIEDEFSPLLFVVVDNVLFGMIRGRSTTDHVFLFRTDSV